MRHTPVAALLVLVAALPAWGDESFDISKYEKKAFEYKGYLELKPEEQFLNQGATGYLLQFPNDNRTTADRWSTAAELSGVLRHQALSFNFTAHGSYLKDVNGSEGDARFFEAYGRWQADPRSSIDIGKRSLGWGKGYAWNPVAFLDRPKDPVDPELSREGFVMADAEWTRSFSGPLRTLALMPVVVPTTADLNPDFGTAGHINPAVKLYGLAFDTDVDLIYAAKDSRPSRFGADFSRNLGSNLEIHGEWAHTVDAPRALITPSNTLAMETLSYTSYLLGLRYLTERETTFIAEYYHNGAGYTESEMQRFFTLVHDAASTPALVDIATRAAAQGYNSPSAMRDYGYLRVSQNEPFDILYFTPAVTLFVNPHDHSYALIPEAIYTGVTNFEFRLRFQLNHGGAATEYGEKAVRSRIELRVRYFF